MAVNNTPEWVDGKKINEVLFCADFLKEYPMVSRNGTFFTVDGLVSDENLLKKKIYDFLKPYVSTGLPKKVSNLLEVLRMECCTEDLPLQTDRIHVENGTLFLDGTFTPEKEFCRNRLAVSYNPDAPEPVAWKAFLSQLLYPEDKALKKAEKEQKAEIAQLKKEVDSGKPSVQRLLELEKKVQQQEELQRTISSLQQTLTAIPPEIIAEYNEPKSERKETKNHVQNI